MSLGRVILPAVLSQLLLSAAGTGAAESPAPTHVALMDFSVDDNSYRNAQAAANFTALLQIEMGKEPGVEWVERAQLALARQELGLSDLESLSGSSAIRRGKLTGADWLVTGQFSLDDQSRRTLFLEITELRHADVLASQTITFPSNGTGPIKPDKSEIEFVANGVREVLGQARVRRWQTEDKIRLAPLFLADITRFGPTFGMESFEREFFELLEAAAATNNRVRLIRLPRAFRAADEAEMVLDGLVDTDGNAWQQTADLYVWGTYARTNSRVGGKSKSILEISLHVWDGSSRPEILREELSAAGFGAVASAPAVAALNRLTRQVIDRARMQSAAKDSRVVRRQIAESVVETYLKSSGHEASTMALHEPARFAQAVHMLESACFFDPDNANADVLRITCRWGWWMDFRSQVKNPFWSYWRRSRAWGLHVDRFGLSASTVPLPFPYQTPGVRGEYVRSLEQVIGMFPQLWNLENGDLTYAERQGFPKDISRDDILNWKAQLEQELANRRRRVAQYEQTVAPKTNRPLAMTSSNAVAAARRSPAQTMPKRSVAPGPVSSRAPFSPAYSPPMNVPVPAWLKQINPLFTLFNLPPPALLPVATNPPIEEFHFPAHFEVDAVLKLGFCDRRLLILALDKRSAPSSDPNPDVSAELLNERGRLWCLDPGGNYTRLFEERLLPASIQSFLPAKGGLWLAGDTSGVLDLQSKRFRKFGAADGLTSPALSSFCVAGGKIFATGEHFALFKYDEAATRWGNVPLPSARLSAGTGNPVLINGDERWLNYVAGSTLFRDVATGGWTNLNQLAPVHCSVADKSGFWLGGRGGLQFLALDDLSARSWSSPTNIPGISVMGAGMYQYPSQSTIPAQTLTNLSGAIVHRLKGVQKNRSEARPTRTGRRGDVDPLHLDSRMPGDITAFADDGDYLWVGTGSYSGGRLLVIHKPSASIVGCCSLSDRGGISSLAVSDTHVWIGRAYGDQMLIRMPKSFLLSTPRTQWLSLAISAADRSRLIKSMTPHAQAMYAFYAGDDAQVANLLANADPANARIDEMFLLAWSYDAFGLDKPERTRFWYDQIISRYPDSPWAEFAQTTLAANEEEHKARERESVLLARYDRNRDGLLDSNEKQAMQRDTVYQREEKSRREEQLGRQVGEIMTKFDLNGDGKLDLEELTRLRSEVVMYAGAPPDMLAGRKIVVLTLLTKDFPPVSVLIKKYDLNHDGGLNAAELRAFARDIKP